MDTLKELVDALFEFRNARSKPCERHIRSHYLDEVVVDNKCIAYYMLHGVVLATLDRCEKSLYLTDGLILVYEYNIISDAYPRLVEISKALKNRYGIDIEFIMLTINGWPYEIAFRYGSDTYKFFYGIKVDLEKKAVYNRYRTNPKIYLANDSRVEKIMDLDIGKGFVLTIGTVDGEPVVMFSRYDPDVLGVLPPHLWGIGHDMAVRWMPLNDFGTSIEKILEKINENAAKELKAVVQLLGYR